MTSNSAHPRELAHELCAVARARILDCPVCPRTGLTAGTRHCPNCGVDLRPLWSLRSLPGRFCEEAAEAVRRGDLELAMAMLLCALETSDGESEEVLVLLAKLCRQRGQRRRALEYCRRVLARNPEHAECEQMVHEAARLRAGRVGATALVLLLAACAASATLLIGEPGSWATAVAGGAVDAGAEPSAWVAVARRPEAALSEGALPVLDSLAERLRTHAQVGATRSGSELRVEFPEGLFGGASAVPTAAGAASLRMVASVLDAADTPLLVAVAGATDDQRTGAKGRWGDNAKLAAARARSALGVVLDALRADGEIALRPAVLESAPFPNDTPRGRARNRTVVLHISSRS